MFEAQFSALAVSWDSVPKFDLAAGALHSLSPAAGGMRIPGALLERAELEVRGDLCMTLMPIHPNQSSNVSEVVMFGGLDVSSTEGCTLLLSLTLPCLIAGFLILV